MGQKVLIIDDDPITRRILHTIMKAESFTTALAADATGALAQARAVQPDLILLDLGLPGGGGLLFLHRLQQFPKLAVIPVIVISASDDPDSESRSLEGGAAAYLSKPVEKDRVLEAVRRVLGTA